MTDGGKGHLGGCILAGDIGTFAPQVWDALIAKFEIKTMLDIGCGAGYAVQYFRQKCVYAKGVEGWEDAIAASPVKEHIFQHDFTKGIFIPAHGFDLAWCCEFVEHVEEQFAGNFLTTFQFCRYVAMTFAIPGQPGYHHVNCQPQEYWVKRMAERGFVFLEEDSVALRKLLFKPDGSWQPNGGHCRERLLLFRNDKY